MPAWTPKHLDRSARLTGRSKFAIAAEAIERYLSWRIPQQECLQLAIEEADRAGFAGLAEVTALFDRYARR